MTDRPIIFSGLMVRALLAGTKTQTRRLATSPLAKCQLGDRLWMRERWQDYCPLWGGAWCGHGDEAGRARDHQPVFFADSEEKWTRGPEGRQVQPLKWRPSIHMPRWASRLTLEVTEVRLQKLHEISEEDARAEGLFAFADGGFSIDGNADSAEDTARETYAHLWDRLHGPGSWDANPKVVALTFSVHSTNIDTLPPTRAA